MAIEVGTKVSGKISGITNFGAFVNLGDDKTGLVHISEISDSYVKDIHDVLTVGDTVTVKVMTVGNDGKIGLSIRKVTDHPEGEHEHKPEHKPEHHSNGEHRSNSEHRPNGEHRPASRPHNNFNNNRATNRGGENRSHGDGDDFDSLLSGFLKDSEQRLTTIKRNTEGKRGGRGGRRS